jgi:anti-sigma regulatory factor (Ser/Thr protein kinase)
MSTDQPPGRSFVNPETGATRFLGDARSVTAARRHTVRQLADWGLGGVSVAASLLVTELAANAVRHAHTDFELELTCDEGVVHIAVSDSSVKPPIWRKSTPFSRSGFGLSIVNELSSEWGWELQEHGKRVWADLGTWSEERSHRENEA